ncbi:aminotransferase class V-fold PLP-dependent enzyme [Desulfoscipio geothermicus]|uniref:cysteine desulfurase n=1 Tax=Desulfoscipio geothermicus DSM 3669 TaxID=1121426 RepID=A0A1I6E0P6_9FIRM|nr:aminotransferase class V-fold PLP-dependent enzyme [Desulfoscipio geothermicus]SFR11088.1 cysteine desulfurase family protein [Desulfoscipio geothermicus DSM 3669]
MSIYLDNAATSFPKPEAVYRAVDNFLRNIGASSGRGAYRKALQADKIAFQTRKSLARLFNIQDASRIVFTANVTESLNLAMQGILKNGDHVVTTGMEHNAVWRCLKQLEKEKAITITAVPCSPEGYLEVEKLAAAIRPNTALVVLLHASNVTGTVMPIEQVGELTRQKNIPLLVDAAQTAGVYPIDVAAMRIDLLAFTGHKGLLGPTGTGGLYINEKYYINPLKFGGTGGESLRDDQPDNLPDRFEAGTPNLAGIAGLGAGVDYILNESVEKIRQYEMELTGYALDKFRSLTGVTMYGPLNASKQVGVISFNLPGLKPEQVAYLLDTKYDIMVRAGLHCAPLAHRTTGTIDRGTVRVGIGVFNTARDVDDLVLALKEIMRFNSSIS